MKNNRRAHQELYDCCFNVLMSIAKRYHKNDNDAVACVNLAFLKIVKSLKSFLKQEAEFLPWIRRIVINVIIDEFRKNKKLKSTIDFVDFADTKTEKYALQSEVETEINDQFLLTLVKKLTKNMSKSI